MKRYYEKCVPCQPIFSDEDADLRVLRWRTDRNGYAKHGNDRAHRLILARMLGRKVDSDTLADHINHNRLDNRRDNLRATDRRGNSQNRITKHGVFRGITLHRSTGKWQAQVKSAGRSFYCGLFTTQSAAAEAAHAMRIALGFVGAA